MSTLVKRPDKPYLFVFGSYYNICLASRTNEDWNLIPVHNIHQLQGMNPAPYAIIGLYESLSDDQHHALDMGLTMQKLTEPKSLEFLEDMRV